jgi:hypothetical protein
MPKLAAAIFTHFVPELPELRSGMVTHSVFSGANASDPFGAVGASPVSILLFVIGPRRLKVWANLGVSYKPA